MIEVKMKVKYTVAIIIFIAAIATFIGVTAHNTFAVPNLPIQQQEQVNQYPQSIQTIITGTDNDREIDDNEVEEETNGDSDDHIDPQLASQAKITPEEAKTIAVNHVSAQASDVKEVELEDENGHLVYSVEIMKAGQLLEVEVDANNGKVMNVEQDADNDADNDDE